MTAGPESEEAAAPERAVRYRWAAGAVAGGRVLDAGCGAGWGTALLAREAEAVGVDLSPAAIAAARREHGEEAEFAEGDLGALPFGEAAFDAVVCFEALTHLADPAAALAELRRVLRPGGLLLASAPNPAAYPAGNPLELSRIEPAELEAMLGERFAKVAVHPQRACLASLLGEPPAEPVGDAPPGGPVLYAVAAASDGPLPPAPALLATGEPLDPAGEARELAEWRERAVRAEARALALARELRSGRGG